MNIDSKLLMGILNYADISLTANSLKGIRSYKLNSLNTFYKSGFIIDRIDKIPSYDLAKFETLAPTEVSEQLDVILQFFHENKYIHVGNLQTFASLSLIEGHKSVIQKIKISKSQQFSYLETNLLDVFSPTVIAQTNDYERIINAIFSFYEYYLIHSKSAVYGDHGELLDLYNPILYLEKFSNLKMEKYEFTKLFNSFFATFNYGLCSIEGFYFTKIDGVLYNQFLHADYTFDIIHLVDKKQTESKVIQAFKVNPDKIEEIESLHNSYKSKRKTFETFDDLFLLIENYIRIDCYSKFELAMIASLEDTIAAYLRFIKKYELRLFCFFTIMSIDFNNRTNRMSQLDFCCEKIKKIDPLLIPVFEVE